MLSDQFFWFATRSAGLLCWFAATGSVGVGLLMSTRALGRKPTIPWLLDVHRFLGAASIVFLALHLVTLWADDFIDFGPAELFIPGRAQIGGLSDLALALGVVAAWILLIVEASSLIKDHLPKRFWHTLHLTSFATVILGLIHGIEVGSDTDNRVLIAASVSSLMAVLVLTAIRVSRVLSDRKYRYELEASVEADHLDEPEGFDVFDRTQPIERLEPVDRLEPLVASEPLDRFRPVGTLDTATARSANGHAPPQHRQGRPRAQRDFALGDRATNDY